MLQTYLCGLRKNQNIFCVHSKLHIPHLFKVVGTYRSHLIFVKMYLTDSLCFYGFSGQNKPKKITKSVSYHTQQLYQYKNSSRKKTPTDRRTDIATLWKNRPRADSLKMVLLVIKQTILTFFQRFKILKGCIGSKVTEILLNGWILTTGGIASGRDYPAAWAAGLLIEKVEDLSV